MTQTNATTTRILDFFLSSGIFAWRQNVAPIPIQRKGVVIGFRSGGRSGIPDIISLLPPKGTFCGIEVKTGKDRLRPSQRGFHCAARKMGAIVLVVKDYDDFLKQFRKLSTVD